MVVFLCGMMEQFEDTHTYRRSWKHKLAQSQFTGETVKSSTEEVFGRRMYL